MTEENISAIRARLKFKNLDEFGKGYARYISSGGIFIPMSSDRLKPVGALIRFQFLLHDGSTALLGEGRVHQVREKSTSGKAPVGMLVKFTKLSQTSKQLVDQIVRFKQRASDLHTSSEAQTQEAEEPTPTRETPDFPSDAEQGYTSLEEETRAGPSPQDATPTRHLEPENQPSPTSIAQADDAPTKDGDDAPVHFGLSPTDNPFASRAETRTSSEPLSPKESDPPTREIEPEQDVATTTSSGKSAEEEEEDEFFRAFDLGLSNPSIIPAQALAAPEPKEPEHEEPKEEAQEEVAAASEAQIYDQALFGDSDVAPEVVNQQTPPEALEEGIEQPDEEHQDEVDLDASVVDEPSHPEQEDQPHEEGGDERELDQDAEQTPQDQSLDTSHEDVDVEASVKLAQETLLEPSSEHDEELAGNDQGEPQEASSPALDEQVVETSGTESSAEILLDEAILQPPAAQPDDVSSPAQQADEEEVQIEDAPSPAEPVKAESPQEPAEIADVSPSRLKARASSIKLPPPPSLPGPPALPKPPGLSGSGEEVDLGLIFADDEGDSLFDDILMPGFSASAKPLENPGNYNQIAAQKEQERKQEQEQEQAKAQEQEQEQEQEQDAIAHSEPPVPDAPHTQETISSPEILVEQEEEESLDDLFDSLEPPKPPPSDIPQEEEELSLDDGAPAASSSSDEELPPSSPRKLAQTAGGLQVLAYDQNSEIDESLEALSIAEDAEDIDLMFDGIFGSGGGESEDDIFGDVFGGGAQEDVSLEILDPISPADPIDEEEPSLELSSLLHNLESDEDEPALDVNHLDLQGPSIVEEDEPSAEEEEESLAALLESARQDIDKLQQQKEEEEPDDTLLTNLLGEDSLRTPDEPQMQGGPPPLPDARKKEKKGGLFSKLFKKE